MPTTRRTFLKTSLATTVAAGLPWRATLARDPIELKLASFLPPMHTIWANVLTPWAKDIEKLSNGRVKVRLFPSMQLGGKPPELYRQMVQGIADIVFTLPGYTSADFPMMSLTELPGVASSAEDGTRKLWARFDEFFAGEYKDAKVLMLWNADNAGVMTRSRPVRTIGDWKGLRIRSPSAAQAAQIETMGGVPISMPVTQIYNAIERGTLDGAQIPMAAMLDFKLIDVVQYLTVGAPLGRGPFVVAMNRKRYEALPTDLRQLVDETTGLELSLKGAAGYDNAAKLAFEAAKNQREVYELPQAEHDRWLARLQPLIVREMKRVDALGLPGSRLVKSYGLVS